MFKKFVTFFKTRKKYQVKVVPKIFRYRRPNIKKTILFLGVFEAVRRFLFFGWVDRIEILDFLACIPILKTLPLLLLRHHTLNIQYFQPNYLSIM